MISSRIDDDAGSLKDGDVLKNPFASSEKSMLESGEIKTQRRLDLKPVPEMDGRVVEIGEHSLVFDGLMQSHKTYKIRSYKSPGTEDINVTRRYSDFEWIVCQLIEKYPGCIIPPIPEKNILTTLNQENEEFINDRKRGMKYFLDKMFKHKDLRYAPEFVEFIQTNDTSFLNLVEKTTKKTGGFMPSLANIVDYMPSVPGYSFFSSLISGISGPEKVKREKTEADTQMESYARHIDFLEQNVNELVKYLSQLAQVEKEQANTMFDMGANLEEIAKLDKENKVKNATRAYNATEKGAEEQRSHAKYMHENLELALRDVSRYIISAKDALKRRGDFKDAIEKNETKLYELKRQNIDRGKISQQEELNEENKRKLEQIDRILPHELEDFKREMTEELEQIAKNFVEHQIKYTSKMAEVWTANKESQ